MSVFKLSIAVLAFFCMTSVVAEPALTVAAKAGKLKTPSGSGKLKGLSFGYIIDQGLSLELDILEGDVTNGDAEHEYESKSLFLNFKTEGLDYLFLKMGHVKSEVNLFKDSGFGIGLGAGYMLSKNTSAELEYVKLESKIKYVGATILYRF